MDYFKFSFKVQAQFSEILLAFLSELPFDTFEEKEYGLEAYLAKEHYNQEVDAQIAALQGQFDFSYEKTFLPYKNWNEAWESNFHPIEIGDFCSIRAKFHPPNETVKHELVITPKMAFGTGHHETTYMMVQLMQELLFTNEKILDYGCGTGILAILASKLGADEIDAVDIELPSYQNTIENCETNKVLNVNPLHGGLGQVSGKGYGIVLANINRNVILDSLPALSKKMKTNGILVISGFISADEKVMLDALKENHFKWHKTIKRNNWLAMQCSFS